MHIICSEPEYKGNLEHLTQLPPGTTVVVCGSDERQSPLYRMLLTGREFELAEDFVERDRKWKRGEEAQFKKDKTAKDVLDFFVRHQDDSPYREYSAMSNLEFKFFRNIRHAGTYFPAEDMDGDKNYNVFYITIRRNDDINSAAQEVSQVVKAQKRWHGEKRQQHYFEIMSHREDSWKYHVLFGHGVWVVTAPYETPEFKTLKAALKYIQQQLWYGD